MGTMYIGGYAIECVCQALVCYYQACLETPIKGAKAHRLSTYLGVTPRYLAPDITRNLTLPGPLKDAWQDVSTYWMCNYLRYNFNDGIEGHAKIFIEQVLIVHGYLSREIVTKLKSLGQLVNASEYEATYKSVHTQLRTLL